MATLNVQLPDDVSEQEARLLLALKLWEKGHISYGKAAEMAGVSKREFMTIMGEHGLCIFDLSPEELDSDVRNVLKACGQ